MKPVVVFCLVLSILFGCSQQNANISKHDKKIYEFSWCTYKDGFKAQDLNNELISYLGFLKNLKTQHGLHKETKYLDPSFKQKKYDFSWLDIFENELEKKAFYEFAENSEIHKNWLSSKDEIIVCDSQKQTFHETIIVNDYDFLDGDQTYVGFCKLKDGFDLNYLMPELRKNSIFVDRPYNQAVLIPDFNMMDFNFLIFLETNFVMNDLNLVRKNGLENACEEYENYSANSLLFNTYIID
tara:strand:+ start:1911 stop:2630 length:720 start_codon:yes stop_codon:yes gene_type:complete